MPRLPKAANDTEIDMEISLQKLASMLNGQVEGSPEAIVVGVAGIREARSDQITFLANPKYESFMADTQAGGIIVDKHWAGTCSRALIRVDNPYLAFARASQFFHQKTLSPLGVSPQAWVDDSAKIGDDVSIHPFCLCRAQSSNRRPCGSASFFTCWTRGRHWGRYHFASRCVGSRSLHRGMSCDDP